MTHVGYNPDEDATLHPPRAEPIGLCEWCRGLAYVRVEIRPSSGGATQGKTRRYRAAQVYTVCPTHAHSFLAQGAVLAR